ncbi:MAG: CDGSH iron-sulfur domain-containing protein [Gammaproteobacteria bacterium]|nr:MAG: CDGSH iron-sulfur domain-containing protein [Gammaproteobacteria bacterium]
MSEKNVFSYPGNEIDVTWDGRLCIHIAECGRAEGELFVTGRKPWCLPDTSSIEEVIEVCERCPSGALTYNDKYGSVEQAPDENTVLVSYNGPLFIIGDLEIEGLADDMPEIQHRVALCRCGQSKNKPFCDNSHIKAGFTDYGAVGEKGTGAVAKGGKLNIRLPEDGPLKITGNMKIMASSGRIAWQGDETALCRCGASEKKPFCDGSHRKTGFSSK